MRKFTFPKLKKRKQPDLNTWLSALLVSVIMFLLILGIFTGPKERKPHTSLLEGAMNAVDTFLYGGPTNPDPTLPESGEVKVYIIDVGQGESILLASDQKSILIDAGENDKGDEVLNFISRLGLDHLDYVMATHPDSDHIGGMDTVINHIDVGEVLFGELPEEMIPDSTTYTDVLDAAKIHNVPLSTITAGDKIDLGSGAVVTILGPVYTDRKNLNNTSLVCRLDFGERSFLFNGDQESEMEHLLVNSNVDLDCDMMTMGHHGSDTSSCPEYVKKVSPQYASISCGRGNDHGHPSQKTLDLLEQNQIQYYRTDLSGNITFSTDGESITVSTQKM